MEKHTVAMVFLRKAIHIIERILKPKAHLLSEEDLEEIRAELTEAFNTEIMSLLDDLLKRERL